MRIFSVALLMVLWTTVWGQTPLRVVGVLGNTSGLSPRPVPYAFYTGIAVDSKQRLYLSGSAEGIPVCSEDGPCLAVLPLPQAEGMVADTLMTRAGEAVFFVARHPNQPKSALYRIDTTPDDANALRCERLVAGNGFWAISPTLDEKGRLILGISDIQALKYFVATIDPAADEVTPLFTIEMPKGATRPWRHILQVDQDGIISIQHAGGVNWNGRYTLTGERVGDALDGLLMDKQRYHLGYSGRLRRMDATNTKPDPGECGSGLEELRMPAQVVRDKDRYFFAGRGGAVEARFEGGIFKYTRRVGALFIEDMASSDPTLACVVYNGNGNFDVQHTMMLPKDHTTGAILPVDGPLHSRFAQAVVQAPEGMVLVSQKGKDITIEYVGDSRGNIYNQTLPQVQSIGQAAVQGRDLLLADPKAGVIWKRPLLDKTAPVTPWRAEMPGVTGLAVSHQGIFVASATTVVKLTADNQIAWTSPEGYKGIRRLAAAGDFVYVCDTAGMVVDALEAATGKRVARLGDGTPGSALQQLRKPYAIAADLNGVYVADNGNGRIVIATTTLWKPDIRTLSRDADAPFKGVTVPVKPPAKGRMSVNIYDANDVTVRQVACAQSTDDPVTWDGRDQYGRWVAPGTYNVHGIIAPKFQLKYVGSVGQSGTPPYRTADGTGSWGGVWGNVMDICPVTDAPGSDILVLWAFEEGEGGLIRMSQDGAVRWKCHLDWWMKTSQVAVASDGANVYITGASAMGAPDKQGEYHGELNRPILWRVDAATGVKKLYAPSGQMQPMFGDYKEGSRIVTDIAVRDGKVYLTAPAQNTLYVADAATGQQLAAWKIDNVSGVAFTPQGELHVGRGSDVVVLNGTGAVIRTVLQAGAEICDIDIMRDRMAVSLGGARQQVLYGKLVLGKTGGRPLCGKMQPENFLNPAGLCITGNGKLFVAENAVPRRFTRWNTDGKLEREFHGPYYYSGMFAVDEEQPEYIYGDTHGDIIRYKVDYATGKWQVDAYWIHAYQTSGVPAKWFASIRHRDGKTYWCSGSGGIVELADDRARGVAAVYGGWVEKLADGNYVWAEWRKKTGFKGTWSDLNGDGNKQADEWQVTDKPAFPITNGGPQQGWGAYFDKNFDLYMHDWSDDAAGGVWKIPVVEWKGGAPVYRWDKAVQVGGPRGHGLQHGAGGARTAFYDGTAVYGFNGGYNAANLPGVGHGHDWEFAQITKYDPATGKPIWHAGERAPGFLQPGQMYCPTGAAGVINEYLFWTDENSLVHAWDTRRGLYVDTLLEDISRGPEPTPYTVWVELFNTRIFRHPGNGKIYLMAASDAIHIFEVIGTDQRPTYFDSQITLTKAKLDALRAEWESRLTANARALMIRHTDTPVKIDGTLNEFVQAASAVMPLHDTARAEIRLLADEMNLYLAANVIDDSPWKNALGDATAFFATGDEVSLWLGSTNGKRALASQDVRLLLAPGKDTPVQAVVYRPKSDAPKRVPFRSPSGEVWMDRVEATNEVQATVVTHARGYRLEAAIPWTLIGKPAGDRVGLDLSVSFSDPAGQRTVACLHWGRNGATIVYDLPAQARFEPEQWGIGILER